MIFTRWRQAYGKINMLSRNKSYECQMSEMSFVLACWFTNALIEVWLSFVPKHTEMQHKPIYNPMTVSCIIFPWDNSGQEVTCKGLTLFLTSHRDYRAANILESNCDTAHFFCLFTCNVSFWTDFFKVFTFCLSDAHCGKTNLSIIDLLRWIYTWKTKV